MSIHKNIKKYREINELTQGQLADKLNLSRNAVSQYENGKREPSIDTQILMADLFGVSLDELNSRDVKNKYEVPVYRAVSCGNPFIADEDIIDYEEINPKLKILGDHFGLRLKGDSMEPNFKEGDVVIVRKQSTVDSGDIAIVRVNGDEATMKIVEKSPEGVTLIATNTNVFLPKFYNNYEIETVPVEIIGKVIEQRRKF